MRSTSGSLFGCLVAALWVFTCNVHRCTADASREESTEPLEASDSVTRLPELYSDAKLPVKRNDTDLCFGLVGCIRRFKSFEKIVRPLEMNAAFNVATKSGQVKVRYNETRNCLKGASKCDIYPFDLSLIEKSTFNPKDRTFVVIGGWNSNEPDVFLQAVKEQWLTMNESVNIIETHWTGGSKSVYWRAVPSTRVFARQLAVFIYYLGQMKGGHQLTDANFTGKFNFVGHSLGAHIAGFVGKDLGGQVGLITALDPALPSFEEVGPEFRLDRTDAKLVQVLHTNGGKYGQAKPLGDLDFYANDGMVQPGCKIDTFTGCSHNRATALYIQFLQNEIYLRFFLAAQDRKYHINHRLFAYHSPSFGEFQNGSSFMDNCYSTVFGKYSTQDGIRHCTVPIDFVTEPDRQLHHLRERYNIDIEGEKGTRKSSRKLYFHTAEKTPFLNNHHLLKFKALKSASVPARCDVSLKLQMAGGASTELVIKDYKFTSLGEHLELAVPFLSMNMKSKYELAGLDAEQFYKKNMTKLEQSMAFIFPSAVRVKGYPVGELKSKKSWSKALMDYLGFGEKHEAKTGCDLNVISVTIQPMKKLSRLLIASYNTDPNEKQHPYLVFLLERNTAGFDSKMDPGEKENNTVNEFYLNYALVGPYDDDATGEDPEVATRTPETTHDQPGMHLIPDEEPETSSVPKSEWFMLTMVTIGLIVAFVYWQTTSKPIASDQVMLTEAMA